MRILQKIQGAIESATTENKVNHGRRAILLTALSLAASACTPNLPDPTRVTPSRIPTSLPTSVPAKTNEQIADENGFVIIRKNLSISPEGEPAFMVKPVQERKITLDQLGEKSPFSRETISISGVTLNIFKLGIDRSNTTDYKSLLENALKGSVLTFKMLSSQLGLSEPKSIANEISITLNTTVIPARNRDVWPLAEKSDNNISSLIKAVMANQRVTPPVAGTDGSLVKAFSLTDGRNLIGFNVAAPKQFGDTFRLNGIDISDEEAFQVSAVNEFATFFLEYYQKNKPADYQKLVVHMKQKYKFPPTENPNYMKNLASRAKLHNRKEDDLVNDAIFEGLTTIIELEYLEIVLRK